MADDRRRDSTEPDRPGPAPPQSDPAPPPAIGLPPPDRSRSAPVQADLGVVEEHRLRPREVPDHDRQGQGQAGAGRRRAGRTRPMRRRVAGRVAKGAAQVASPAAPAAVGRPPGGGDDPAGRLQGPLPSTPYARSFPCRDRICTSSPTSPSWPGSAGRPRRWPAPWPTRRTRMTGRVPGRTRGITIIGTKTYAKPFRSRLERRSPIDCFL